MPGEYWEYCNSKVMGSVREVFRVLQYYWGVSGEYWEYCNSNVECQMGRGVSQENNSVAGVLKSVGKVLGRFTVSVREVLWNIPSKNFILQGVFFPPPPPKKFKYFSHYKIPGLRTIWRSEGYIPRKLNWPSPPETESSP